MASLKSNDASNIIGSNIDLTDKTEDSDTAKNQNSSSMQTSVYSFGDLQEDSENQISSCDKEEKQRLIGQILELQRTLDDLSTRVESVKKDNLKLRKENRVLGEYIEGLMATSPVFQSTSPNLSRGKTGTSVSLLS